MWQSAVLVVGSLASCVLLSGCGDYNLFTPPERGSLDAKPPPNTESVITLVATLPYSTLTRIGDEKLPRTTPLGGDGRVACLGVPYVNPGHVGSHEECFNKPYLDFRGAGTERVCITVPDITGPSIGTRDQCADYHWHASIDKDGPLNAGRAGDAVQFSQRIHVTGQAGLGGTLAEILSLKAKNIDIRATPRFSVAATLDANWCPVTRVVPLGSWVDAASVEIVGRNCVGFDLGALGHPQLCAGPVHLGLANELNHEFDKHRDDLEKGTQSAIPCDTIRSRIIPQWRPYSIKIERDGLTPLYINITPKSAAFSGITAEDDQLRVAVRLGALTGLAAQPVDTSPVALPPLQPLDARDGSLQINLHAIAGYDLLRRELALALLNKQFQADTPAGRVEVQISDIDLYPSGDAIVVGLKVKAKTPGRWLNTTGWVYLSGRPEPIPSGKGIRIAHLHFATVLDNTFWSAAQVVFNGQILHALEAHDTFDLTREIDKASDGIIRAITNANIRGLRLKAASPLLTLDAVAATNENLVATVKLTLLLRAEVTEAILQ